MFADLHCHPHMRSFNWFRNGKIVKKKVNYHPWHIVVSKLKAKEKGGRANAYSQSDLIKLTNGEVKLVFVSLYPMEKGWVTGREALDIQTYRTIIGKTKNKLLKLYLKKKHEKLRRLAVKLGDDKGKKLALRDIIQAIFLKLPLKRIQYLQSNDYDYFEELLEEKDFLLEKNGIPSEAIIFFPFLKRILVNKKKLIRKNKKEFKASGTYEIAQNGNDVDRIIHTDENIAFVFTIEGSNVFNTSESIDRIKRRIDQVRHWDKHPVFFISFAHHFYNYLCGHAHSIPDIGNLVLDQSEGMNTGIKSEGLEIIRYFLCLNDDNKYEPDVYGKRILIDVKHMSAKARSDYYEKVILPCRNNGDHIPVIASHCAYSGIEKLSELMDNSPGECDADGVSTISKPFNTWNINLADEDIREIFRSGGIIGVSLDQRILAIPQKDKKRSYPSNYDIAYFWENIKGMMNAVIQYSGNDIPAKENIVNLFGLGSDFDGYIDPMDSYQTTLEYGILKEDLTARIKLDEIHKDYLFGLSVDVFVEKICFKNAYDFVVKQF